MNVPVLDACCGSRMFWFDRTDERVVFGDIRREEHTLADASSPGGSRRLIIDPDQQMDFRAMPFPNDHFHLVVFDPPHLVQNGKTGWLAKKYGKLGEDWREDIKAGFAECFRVLKPHGTLIFKWNEHEVKVSELLKLTDQKPLFGNRCGKTAKSHWIVFMKPEIPSPETSVRGLEQQIEAAREFVKRHPALTLIDLAEFEAFLKMPAAFEAALAAEGSDNGN